MVQDTSIIKQKIMNFIETNGASLPVEIAKTIDTSTLFTSAFLSELTSEQKLKTSHMKIGSSPAYYIKGKENTLEKYAQYLKSKEKEAHDLLKEKKFLIDSDQTTAIRVALRSIKDFAKPLEKNNKLIWRYFTSEENEYNAPKETEEKPKTQTSIPIQTKKQITPIKPKKEIQIKTPTKKKAQDKKNERFFNTVKEYLNSQEIEISDILGFSKENLILKIINKQEEKILIAFNKKRITEEDIVKAYKKSQEHNLKYSILSMGEPAKKTINLFEAMKNLDSINKI
jgi:hypothetical protein